VSAVLTAPAARALRQRSHWSDRVAHVALLAIALALVAFLALPLATILAKALQDKAGAFVGLANFASYLGTPALLQSFVNSVWVAALVTLVTVPLAFGFAYALSRSCIPAKGMFRTIALIPLLAPTLLWPSRSSIGSATRASPGASSTRSASRTSTARQASSSPSASPSSRTR